MVGSGLISAAPNRVTGRGNRTPHCVRLRRTRATLRGAAILGRRGRKDLVVAWVALVVGLHFVPLAWFLHYPLLGVMGLLMAITAIAGVPLAKSRGLATSAAVGVACGSILVVTGLSSLAVALTW